MADHHGGVRFVLLGPMHVRGQDGELLPVGPPKQQAMMATLALSPGRAVSITRLKDALWEAELPATAVSTVRTYAWRLRQLLVRAGADEDLLVSAGDGYRLAVGASAVDASYAEELAAVASAALAADEPDHARQILSDALALWGGEPLTGVPGSFAERSRHRLTELRTVLTEQLLEAELLLGRYQEVQPRLTEMIAEHPLRERPYVLLMQSLYGMGRQVEALEVFHRARRLLVRTHGIEPGTELTETHERILRGDISLTPAPAREELRRGPGAALSEPATVRGPVPAQLPPDLPDFIGRQEQTASLQAVLTAADRHSPAVLAIIGMSGVGKTSLGVHVAHRVRDRYSDGQLHVNLSDPDGTGEPMNSTDLLALLLAGLGVPAAQVPESPAERRGLLRSLIDGRRMLILLDNVSHPAQVSDALPGTPGCAVLITSRTRLDGLPLSGQLTLEVFDPAESLDLLGQGIGTQRLAAERSDALTLMAKCGYLPLAIRIVASRLAARPRRTLRSMVERLADASSRLEELRAGSLAVGAVFEVGYRQLPAQQARDFLLLAGVAGVEFTMPEAAAVLGLDLPQAELRLESLVDAAMLDEPYPGRFRYHELLYSFALGRERDLAAEASALDRLLALLLATARNAFALAVPGDPTGDALGQDPAAVAGQPLGDLRRARSWASSAQDIAFTACAKAAESGTAAPVGHAVDLLIALSPFSDELRRGRMTAAAEALSEAVTRIQAPAPGSPEHQRIVGRIEFLCSTIALHRGAPDEAEQYARRAVAAASVGEDPAILRQALNDLGLVAQLRHDYPLAVTCFDRATVLARAMGHRSGEVASGLNTAMARMRSGDIDTAFDDCESALALAREMGDDAGIGYALYVLGLTSHAQGRYEIAVDRFTACAAHCLTAGIRDREGHARYRLADSLLALGHVEQARDQAELALLRCEELGAERDQAQALMVLGRVLAAGGRAAEAVDRLTRARALFASLGLPEAAEAGRLAEVVSVSPPSSGVIA
jgi:DNA-binding SARP family transcriptional activator/tetratricopeptide (TPR) repeat protein